MARDVIANEARFGRNPTRLQSTFRHSKVSVWVDEASNPANLLLGQAANNSDGPTLNGYKCRGTVEAPADPVDNDHVQGYVGYAYSGGTWFDVGTLFHKVDGAFVSGQRPGSRWEFHANPANTAPAQKMVLLGNGYVGIGNFNGDAGDDPDVNLFIRADGDADFRVQRSSGDNLAPTFRGRKSRGTSAAPATVQDGDELLYVMGEAYTNAWHNNVGAVAIQVDGAVVAGQRPASRILFRTNISGAGGPSTRMKIFSAGLVYIGDDPGAPDTNRIFHIYKAAVGFSPAKIEHAAGGASNNCLVIKGGDNSTTGSKLLAFNRPDDTEIGSVQQNAAGTVAYNTTSDARLKADIVDSPLGLAELLQVKVRQFRYKSDPTNRPMTGFIAQELRPIFPDAVSTGHGEEETKECDCAMAEGCHDADCCRVNPWGVDYGRMTPLIVRAVQQLEARVRALGG